MIPLSAREEVGGDGYGGDREPANDCLSDADHH
jgi:hypothetical protein